MSQKNAADSVPLQFDITGMHCAACSTRLERALGKIPGVEKASVNLATATARVWGAENEADLAAKIIAQTAKTGFTATPVQNEDGKSQWEKHQAEALEERKRRLGRLWPMLGFTALLLLVSMGHMAGLPLPAWLEPHQSPKAFILVQLFLTLPVVWLGRHFYADGLVALWRKSPNMDSLVAVGTGAAFLYSLVSAFLGFTGSDPVRHAMNLYFEACAALLTMIELGQYLEFKAKRKASDAIGALLSITPETALRLDNGNPVEVPIDVIVPGDHLLIRPGSRVPVDGVVSEGTSAVDLSLLTGESMPVPVTCGADLVAGSVNGEGSLIMLATAVGQNTRLSRIIRMVREAQGTKAPIARLADQVSYYFVPAVMLFGLLAALAWLFFSSQPFTIALTVFVAVLVMACPCAMGLATPMSIMVGTGRGAQLGVLIKNGAALEQTCKITTLCLDKTGTLTAGKPAVTGIHNISPLMVRELTDNDLLALAASLEARSEHPLGLAIIREANKRNCPGLATGQVSISPGLGISGIVVFKEAQWQVFIGNENFICQQNIDISSSLQQKLNAFAEEGQTPLLMALAKPEQKQPEIAAIIGLADQPRPEAFKVVEKLHQMGIHLVMLTGDNDLTAAAIARKVGIEDFMARLLPGQKADYIAELQKNGQIVGMVGDGLNDAPALAIANVGLAVGSGVDISAEAGDIILIQGGMKAVLTALQLSGATMRNIRQNLGWAFGYNILGLPVAAGCLAIFGGPMLNPMFAGTAMALSSFSVVTNALRLRWFKLTD